MTMPVIIIGSGGHAGVVADALIAAGSEVIGFTDSDVARHGLIVHGIPVLGGDQELDAFAPDKVALANGIGGIGHLQAKSLRNAIQQRLAMRGWRFVTVRHPSSVVSPFARISEGAQLLASSVVQPGVTIREGCIVNTAAIVEHDAILDSWVHVAPRALVCGDVVIGARSHIGAGAIVLQGLHLGADTVVGAGAVVVRDFAGAGVLVGIPARAIEDKQ